MLLSAVLLLLLVSSIRATHFYGTVITYYPGNTSTDGTSTVTLRYKLNFRSCTDSDTWTCYAGFCGNQTSLTLDVVDQERSGEWCQREGIMTRRVPNNAILLLELEGGNWISNTKNNVSLWRAVSGATLLNRSDIGRANASPQTTILPALRVPSNCRREFNLLAFDPDGDQVRCRFGISKDECNPCNPPAVLELSPSCTLLFNPVNSSSEGPYAVQLVMEDFSNQNITLTDITGSPATLFANSSLSFVPVQFALRVGPAAPSCTEGLYLPRFLPPTPANRARLYAPLGQTLTINISAEANVSTNPELLFSGPHNVSKASLGSGRYTLRWMPSQSEDGESHPVCFVVQAVSNSVKYQSELRCVIVTVGDPTTTTPTMTTTPNIITTTPTTTITTPTTTTTTPTTTTTTPTTTTTTPTTTTTTPTTTTTTSTTTTTTPTTTTTTPTTTTTTPTTTTTTPTTTSPPPATPPQDTTAVTAVPDQVILGLRVKISSSTPLSEEFIRTTIIPLIKAELVRRGVPSQMTMDLVSSVTAVPAR